MFSKSQNRSLFTLSFILLFICVVTLPLNSQGIASTKAQDNKLEFSPSPASDIGYEFGDLPLIAQSAMVTAIESRSAGILPGGTFFIVGHYESFGMRGIGHVGAAVGAEQPDWDDSVWFIANLEDPAQIALEGTPIFNDFFSALPKALQDEISPESNNEINAQATVFLFPWDKSQQWRYTYGWHGSTNLTLDFAPYNVAPSDMWVLASAGGTITLVCGGPNYDLYQVAINLTTANGVMTYRHIDYNSFIGQNVKDTVVNQGRKLSLLYNGTQGSGYFDTSQNYPWPTCVQGSSASCTYIKFNTYCGAGTGAHNHWTLPAKPFTVDGWQVGEDAIWRKSGQANKGLYSYFNSTNPLTLINSISRTDTNPSNTSSVNFTVTFSESVTGVGISDFSLTTTGVSNAAVSGVSGSGSVYTVTVNTGTGDGTIRLDVVNDGTIKDVSLNTLNGGYSSGEVYTIIKNTLTLTPSNLDFGDQLFRTSNPAQQVTVKNINSSAILIGSLGGSSSVGTTADANKSFFISSDTCSSNSLVTNEECTFNVTFLPWSLGAKTGSISIPSDAADSPHEVSLNGNSIAGSQLLLNRSFESVDVNGMPTSWSRSPLIKNGLDGTDLSWVFNGSRSMKLVGDGDLKILTQRVDKAGVAGDDFSMFVVTKGDNIPAGADRWLMQIMFYNGATIVENRNVNLAIGTHTDSRITVMYTAASTYTHIMFRIHYGKASGTAWVDLASLQWAP